MPSTDARKEEVSAEHLRRTVEELRIAVRARDEFIAIAAHELRNPMTPVLMHVEALRTAAQRGTEPKRIVAGLKRLELAIEQYIRRATTLLDVSRITSGKLLVLSVPVDVTALVRRVAANFDAPARRAGCRLDVSLEEHVHGLCDPLAIEQVLENLLSNAIKFGAGKSIDITLASEPTAGAGVRFAVRDRGPGISAEDRARVFERFEQTVIGRERGGFGVGLWLVGQLVAAMGGRIEIDSRPAEGSEFTVILPCADAARAGEGRDR